MRLESDKRKVQRFKELAPLLYKAVETSFDPDVKENEEELCDSLFHANKFLERYLIWIEGEIVKKGHNRPREEEDQN